MKNIFLTYLVLSISLISFTASAQTENTEDLLGLPGDNLDLYAVLDLFQKSKTIEDFEKSLNDEKSGINNLDLNNDEKIDFIKVETQKEGNDFLFILQDPINEKETQDVAVISVTKDDAGKVSMQIIGDKDLYGKDYIIEPKSKPTAAITANPGYTGDEPVESVPASSTVVVVQSAPIVQYVYSPAYVPYYPPYYYGYYPPYWRPVAVVAIGIYRHNNWYHHGGYHGSYHGNTNININRNTQINHYNNGNRNTSNTVNNNVKSGNYNTAGKGTNRASTGASTSQRPSTGSASRPSTGASTSQRPSTGSASRPSTGASTSQRPSTGSTSRPSTGASASQRPSSSSYNSGSRSRASSSYSRPSTGSMSRGGGGGRRR